MERMIVCGWYTPDYAECARRLVRSLERFRAPHDLVSTNKLSGGWERNTMAKASHILAAMDRHPDKIIVFTDVDCEALKPLDSFADIATDIAVHMRGKMLRSGWPRWMTRTTVVVVSPTPAARACIELWEKLSDSAVHGSVDQRTFPVAIARTPGLSVMNLPLSYCAMDYEHEDPILRHDHASKDAHKMPKLWRLMLSLAHAKSSRSINKAMPRT